MGEELSMLDQHLSVATSLPSIQTVLTPQVIANKVIMMALVLIFIEALVFIAALSYNPMHSSF